MVSLDGQNGRNLLNDEKRSSVDYSTKVDKEMWVWLRREGQVKIQGDKVGKEKIINTCIYTGR